MSDSAGNLPNLVILGAMKCGTSSLHQYLNLHPQIEMCSLKELDFFITERNWERGLEWYKSNFPKPAEILGESSPNYTKCHRRKGVPKRMHSIIPDAKLIYVVRDPIERIISHYVHNVTDGLEKPNLSAALSDLANNHYVNTSRYYWQLEQYLPYYPQESILVICSEDLGKKTAETMSKVFAFLNVDTSFKDEKFAQVYHKSSQKKQTTTLGKVISPIRGVRKVFQQTVPQWLEQPTQKPILSESQHDAIAEVLKEDIEKLKAFTGYSFAHWSL